MKIKSINIKILALLVLSAMLKSCATYKEQVGEQFKSNLVSTDSTEFPIHEILLIGDAGDAHKKDSQHLLRQIETYIKSNQSSQSLLFLGDNIYPLGMPMQDEEKREQAEYKLEQQIRLAEFVNGQTIFIPGNHDWYNGIDGLIEQKKYIEEKLGKKSFLPRKFDAIDAIEINEQITLITIDSEWFIQDWDRHSKINEESIIKSREDFFEEFRSLINKNQNKITVVAIHHPLRTNGSHGGYFSLRQHVYPYQNIPAPIVGTLINYLRKTSGASPADTQHTYYRMLINRLETIVQNQEQVIFVSGHEHNLQYIEDKGIKQIISGSASKTEEVRSVQPSSYAIGSYGFATLKVFPNNKVDVAFYKLENEKLKLAFEKTIIEPIQPDYNYPAIVEEQKLASVYAPEEINKSAFYRFLFGQHYRSIYGTKITASIADLSDLYGGLSPIISGGGNQSLSLRLQDNNGKQYVMRGLRKSSKQFLQTALFKDKYIKDQIDNTYVLDIIDDHYTTSHPYVAFVLEDFSNALGLYHTRPKLFYVPKQNSLGRYNDTYGDELYMIEERPHKSQKELPNFGNGEDIISTTDVLYNLEKDEKYQVDKDMYLKARIFDFLIGDWDRHSDQWRWVEKSEKGKVIYQPIPRDRDQAFAKLDGNLLRLLNKLPALRHMQNFSKEFAHPRWINKTAFPLDKVFLQNTALEDWKHMAEEVKNTISDNIIASTFDKLPEEIKNQYTSEIIEIVKARREKLVDFAESYYKELMKYGVVTGTNKKDTFKIYTSKNAIEIEHIRNKKSGDVTQAKYSYDASITKEIWIYGLDDDDQFVVEGEKSPIQLLLIGGRNHDVYAVHSDTKTTIFDYKSKNNTIENNNNKLVLRDQYQLNQYDYRKTPINIFTMLPDIGYNRDNQVMLGFNAQLTVQKFNQNPYTQQHQLRARYDFATSGLVANYEGSFKDYSRKGFWNIQAMITSSNFSRNFFGINNLATYSQDLYEDNYYRVRTSQFDFKPSYQWKGRNGSAFLLGATYESTQIVDTHNRFIDEQMRMNNVSYDRIHYLGAQTHYQFKNYDNVQEPTTGLAFDFRYGVRFLTTDWEKNHQYLALKLNFVVPMTLDKKLTWSSSYGLEKLFGDDYHFFQAASLGQNNGLRGYRQHRFIGHTSAITSQDVRYKMNQISNNILPLSYGIYAGVDFGRVWNDNDATDYKWKNSYGVGLWLNALESLSVKVGAFGSKEEDVLFNFGLGFGI